MSLDILTTDGANPPIDSDDVPPNLAVLVDIYKHHWDLFLKGFALYLAACTIFATIASQSGSKADVFQQIFSGVAVTGASIVANRALNISIEFLINMGRSIDAICESVGYSKIYFSSPQDIMRLFSKVTVVLGLVGVLYAAHVIIVKYGWLYAGWFA